MISAVCFSILFPTKIANLNTDYGELLVYDYFIRLVSSEREYIYEWPTDYLAVSSIDLSANHRYCTLSNGYYTLIILLNCPSEYSWQEGIIYYVNDQKKTISSSINIHENEDTIDVQIRGVWLDGKYIWGTSKNGLVVLKKSTNWLKVAFLEAGSDVTSQNFTQIIDGQMFFGCGNSTFGMDVFYFNVQKNEIVSVPINVDNGRYVVTSFFEKINGKWYITAYGLNNDIVNVNPQKVKLYLSKVDNSANRNSNLDYVLIPE